MTYRAAQGYAGAGDMPRLSPILPWLFVEPVAHDLCLLVIRGSDPTVFGYMPCTTCKLIVKIVY